jgi:hypothetical protein
MPGASRTPEQARHDRAAAIDALRGEVGRLQRAIKDAADAVDRAPTSETRLSRERQLATLERQLDQTQRELARYQARV